MVQPRGKRKRAPELEPGFWLDSDLQIIEHLGGSRKVDVYRCHSDERKGLVTCKVLRPEYCIDFSSLEDVSHEGEILMRLRHPNVVEGYGVWLEDYPRIMMQYLAGDTVSATFLSGNFQAFDVLDLVEVVEDVARGLSYVHGEGLLHLDVKPSNVMVDDDHATLFDFSVAEEYSPDTPLKDNAGTVEYMAPEQTRREEVGYATDVFGLGVLCYQLFTGGQLPYPVVERLEAAGQSMVRELDYTTPPTHPSSINPQVIAALGDVALRAIRPTVQERFATPLEFTDALEHATSHLEARKAIDC